MPKYLDDNGLLYFWQKIKSKFLTNVAYDSTNKKLTKTINGSTSDIVTVSTIKTALNLSKSDVGLGNVDNTADANKSVLSATKLTTARAIDGVSFDGQAAITHYGECSTAAATADKVVSCTGYTLATGSIIWVKFTVTNTAAVGSLTLNVNNTGAKAIKYRNANLSSAGVLAANRLYGFVYDGTSYQLIGDLDTNSTYTAASAAPLMDGTAAVGTATKYAREDHVHPSDTTKVDKVSGKGLSTNDFTTDLKTKLEGIATGAEVNQNAFSNVKIGDTTVAADAKTDTLELVAGPNVTLTPDATNDKVTIAATDTVTTVTTTGSGNAITALTASDGALTATKGSTFLTSQSISIDGVTGAYARRFATCSVAGGTATKTATMLSGTLPDSISNVAPGTRVTVYFENQNTADTPKLNINSTGAVTIRLNGHAIDSSNKKLLYGAVDFVYDGTYWQIVGPAIEDTATTAAKGLMSSTDKTKLNGIATGAEVNQNAFSNIVVLSTTITAGAKTDSLEIIGGDNVTITPDATNKTITIDSLNDVYIHPAYTAKTGKPTSNQTPSFGSTFTISQVSSDGTGHVSGMVDRTVKIPDTIASTTAAGLMSSTDKTKLDKLVFDGSNKIDASILPSYVDDVIEAYPRSGQTELGSTWLATGSASGTVITPEAGKIYVLMADSTNHAANTQFRWSGSAYVKLADGGVSSITNAEIDTIVAS